MNCTIREYDDLLLENERLRKALEAERRNSIVYSHIAQALARDYTDLFYVNMDTDEFIEYHTDDERGVLVESRRAADFFESCKREARLYVDPEDYDAFVTAMNRDFLIKALEKNGLFEMKYRRIKNGRHFYVQMKISRMEDDNGIIVLAVSDIDELIRKRRAEERMQEERIVYARLHAITGNFVVVYVVDPESGSFHEFSSTDDYTKNLEQLKEGTDFFDNVRKAAPLYVHPSDRKRYLTVVTRENIMAEISKNGIFTFGYRFLMKDKHIHVQLKAALVEEKEGVRLIVGLNDIDVQVRQEKEMEKRLALAESQANVDALTGVRNRHAWLEAEARIDQKIAGHQMNPFAIVVMDLNDLKKVNDSAGHQAGDQYIRSACRIICDAFKHSPVFRIGGDEFVVIAQDSDYTCLDDRLEMMKNNNSNALQSGGVVIACGVSKYNDDSCAAKVFERADQAMYEDKNRLKSDQPKTNTD